jgi:hypothetical protein
LRVCGGALGLAADPLGPTLAALGCLGGGARLPFPLYKEAPRGGGRHTIPRSLELSSPVHLLSLSLSTSPSHVVPQRDA